MKRFSSISDSVNKRGSFHLLPDYGTILPPTGATFCHCRAQNEASWENFRTVYHRHSEYAFRLQDAWFCSWKTLLSNLPFTLHLFAGNPDKHWGCERWRVGSTLHPPFTHPSPFRVSGSKRFQDARHLIIGEPIRGLLITKLIHHLCIELVIIDDRTVV